MYVVTGFGASSCVHYMNLIAYMAFFTGFGANSSVDLLVFWQFSVYTLGNNS